MPLFSRLVPLVASAFGLQTRNYLSYSQAFIFTVRLLVFALIFVPQQNEMFFDLGGAVGWLSTTVLSLYYPALEDKFYYGAPGPLPALSSFAPRQLLISAAVGIWSIRLGSFLAKVWWFILLVLTPLHLVSNREPCRRAATLDLTKLNNCRENLLFTGSPKVCIVSIS